MLHDVWLNLPVKDVQKSIAFYEALGFQINEAQRANTDLCGVVISAKGLMVMLVSEENFAYFAAKNAADTTQGCGLLISVGAETPQDVDRVMALVEPAGGTVFGRPGWTDGWMYGAGFTDIDGHRYNLLHMDFSKMG